jgi:KDO2-lipid IV(A) lauroyltransferase
MYYFWYSILWGFSRIPFFLLYPFSSGVAFLLNHVFGYRKKVVMENLAIAFPEKSPAERSRIAAQFYRNLTDTFLESIKMLSMSKSDFLSRCHADLEVVNELVRKGKSIQLMMGHQMNWEYANWIASLSLQTTFIGIYQSIGNRAIDRIFYKMRERFGTHLISTRDFKSRAHNLFDRQYAIGLVADQNTHPEKGAWQYFFSRPVPFITGPEKNAIRKNTAVVFLYIRKKGRGKYELCTEYAVEEGTKTEPGELTRRYRDALEKIIRQEPHNYLWSHRRWRHDYKSAYALQWIDPIDPPA